MRRHQPAHGTHSFTSLSVMLACACALRTSSRAATAGDAPDKTAMRLENVATLVESSVNFLGSAQLDSLVDGTSVADAVARLRPEWLAPRQVIPRGASRPEWVSPAVYVDRTYAGGPEELRTIPLRWAREIRFLTPAAGLAQLGGLCRCSAGVIRVLGGFR